MTPTAYTLPTATNSGQGAGGGVAKNALAAMNLPPLNLNQSSSAKSGDVYATFGLDNSGFSVNYGSGVAQGSQGLLIVGGVLLLGFLLWKKRST